MSKHKERMSAFLDSDIHSDELMSFSLSSEAEDAKLAKRYQIIGDAMRNEMSESSFVDVSHAVRDALSGENIGDVALTHKKATKQTDSTAASGWSLSNWFRPAAGMAVAASVAVVMVFSVTGQSPTGSAPVVANAPVTIEVRPTLQLAVDENKLQTVANAEIASKTPDSQQLDQYLINRHLEFATQDTLQGRLPYVRAVSFESNTK